jgi:Tol biopolymer transport system component
MVLTDRSRSTKTWGLAVRNLKSPLDTAWLQFQDNRPDAWPAYFPVISSDARLVAYREPGRPTQLRVIANAVGSEPSTVSVDAPEARAITPAAWKADNSSILVTIVRQDGSAALAWVSRADGAVRLLKDLGWRLRDVVGRPALSPDGQYLAYSALATDPGAKGAIDSAYRRIYVLKADGSAGETAVVAGSPINDAPIWTQDGSRLLFVSNPSGRIDLRAVDVRDGAAQGVPSILWRDLGCRCFIPHHVSAGGVVYFTRDVPAEEHTVIVKMESPGARIKGKAPIVSEVLDGSLPAWSHNGQAIATRMIRERGKRTPNSDDYDTTVYWLGTNQRIRYDLGGTQRTPVRWLHHDEAFLETVREDGQPDSALRVDVRNRESRRIIDYHPSFNTATMARSSEVSGDDKTLYVIRRNPADSQIVAFDLATGEQSVIVTLPLTAFSVKLSPDSRTLAYVGRDAAATHLGRVDVTGESHRELYALTDSRVRQIRPMVAWTSDGQGILFVQEEELSTPLPSPVPPDRQDRGSRNQNMRFRQRVMHIPADGRDGPSPTGLEVIAASLQEMSLSPNGERLAYGVGTGGFELWALDLTRVLQGASK